MRPRLPVAVLLSATLLGCPRGVPEDSDDGDDTWGDDTGVDTGNDTDTAVDTDTGTGRGAIRVVTWNVQTVGAKGTTAYNNALAVLARIDADVVCIDEVADAADAPNLAALGQDLGYTHVFTPTSGNPNAFQRNGSMTRLPVVSSTAPTSPVLSGDSGADDLTRLPVVLTVDLPDDEEHLTVVCQHWKSGFDDVDEFRRLIDSYRTAQAAGDDEAEWVLAMGDVNAEVADPIEFPNPFTSTTFQDGSYLPGSYELGDDLNADLTDGDGLPNNPFAPWDDAGFLAADAVQQDGTNRATRPISGRRIDYIFVGPGVPDGWQTEVFDCYDDDLGGLPKPGEPVAETACAVASDHLPVIIDLAP